MNMMKRDNLRIESLVMAQSFETYWAYYLQSSAQLFAKECRESALLFLVAFDELAAIDPKVKDPVALTLGDNIEDIDVNEIVEGLRQWAQGSDIYPYQSSIGSRFMLFGFFAGLKGLLIRGLELTRWPIMRMTSQEAEYSKAYVKWSSYLPRIALLEDLDPLVKKASSSPTIVLVGDIRRSQDLMTYSPSASDFSRRMVEFIMVTREILEKHAGIFDKFTGDGFLCYFNEEICRVTDLDYIESFVRFVREHLDFSRSHFQEWTKSVQKLPEETVGLAMGGDFGIVSFQNIKGQLIAVGDAIVWASRMASCAFANEILLNNLLYQTLQGRDGLEFEQRHARTKFGEGFLARVMTLKEMTS